MIDPAWGPFLFDTSAESWLSRPTSQAVTRWWQDYRAKHEVHESAITVVERMRGYALLLRKSAPEAGGRVEIARTGYLNQLGRVWPLGTVTAMIAAEIMELVPQPPTLPRKTHSASESKQDRLARWRFDTMIAATAVVAGMRLVNNNPHDFEAVREALDGTRTGAAARRLELIRCSSLVR